MLIEWGHTAYFDNSGEFASQATIGAAGVIGDFLEGTKSFEGLLKEIRNERIKSDGNYNGFLGRVVNFTFSNTGGVYDIDIKLITQGAIIESLVISNTSITSTEEAAGNTSTQSSTAQRSLLSRILLNLTQKGFSPVLDGNYLIDALKTEEIPDPQFKSNQIKHQGEERADQHQEDEGRVVPDLGRQDRDEGRQRLRRDAGRFQEIGRPHLSCNLAAPLP
jgi:hypothetical protein